MSTPRLNVEELLRLREEEICRFLDAGPSQHDDFGASVIATSINELSRELWAREGENEDKIREFLRRLWNLIISIASRIQPDDERFNMLVLMLKHLQSMRSGLILLSLGMAEVWEDMPLLGECLREAADSSFMTATSSSPAKWISLQSLFARLYGQRIAERTDLAIWVLREALEESLPFGYARHAMLEGTTQGLTESAAQVLRVGKLAEGMQPGITKDRWVFWRRRLELLGEQSEQGLKQKVEDAARRMEELEAAYARMERVELRRQFVNDWLEANN